MRACITAPANCTETNMATDALHSPCPTSRLIVRRHSQSRRQRGLGFLGFKSFFAKGRDWAMAPLKLKREQGLGGTRGVMNDAWIGYELLTEHHHADRQLFGLRTLVTSGRGTTFMAQKLRSVDNGFDEWYQPIAREMRNDELCRYFYTLRSTIEKEGLPHPITATLEFLGQGEIVSTASVN